MRVLFITNYPAPYRVAFFNKLGSKCKLTVVFSERPEGQKHRSSKWFDSDYSGFEAVFLSKKFSILGKTVYTDIIGFLKKKYDAIIIGGYSSLTNMYAINYMIRHKIPYYIEADGALLSSESNLKYYVKKYLIKNSKGVFSPSCNTDRFFSYYGIRKEQIIRYHFTSLTKNDLDNNRCLALDVANKEKYKSLLGYLGKTVVLSVGQVIERKGVFELLSASACLGDQIQIIWVGGKPTAKIKEIIKKQGIDNVQFVDFCTKEELEKYYLAADMFLFPTRYDIWGLVINEAMSYGLPVISTNQCGSALELVNKEGGLIIPPINCHALIGAITKMLNSDLSAMSWHNLNSISRYSIEEMVDEHIKVLEEWTVK